MKPFRKFFLLLITGFLGTVVALAQNNDCPALVQQALQKADQFCQNTGRNQACYGHFAMSAEANPNAANFVFEQSGDVINLTDLKSLQLSPFVQDTGQWGVAIMQVQANLPETLPGQNVTLLLYGDTEITPDPNSPTPMQAFYLKTGIGLPGCAEAPRNGLLVQTPQGASTINLTINQVEVEMGSTVFFEAQAGREMKVRTVEGAARIENEFGVKTIPAGSETGFEIDEDLVPLSAPEDVIAYDEETVESLPVEYLERDIEIAEPLDEDELAFVNEYNDLFSYLWAEDADDLLSYYEASDGIIDNEALLDFILDDLNYEPDEFLTGDLEAFTEADIENPMDEFSDEETRGGEEFSEDTGFDESGEFSDEEVPDEFTDDSFDDSSGGDDGGNDDGGDDSGGDDSGGDDGGDSGGDDF